MPVKLNSSGGGSVTIDVPSTASDFTITTPAISGNAVVDNATQTLTNKTLTSPTITGASMSGMASSVLTSGTTQASTSGTAITFTGIPSWAKRVTVMLSGLSTSGSSFPQIRLGTSSGVEATGYTGSTWSSNVGSTQNSTGHALVQNLSAGTGLNILVTIALLNSNTWLISSTGGYTDAAVACAGCSSKTTAATLDRIQLTTVNGTDTFDAGSINILYE